MNIAGPKEREVTVREHRLMRHATEVHVEIVRSRQAKAGPTFDVISWCRRLMQLGFPGIDLFEMHRRQARLEERLVVVEVLTGDDVFEIQTCVGWDEDASRARCRNGTGN